VVVTSNVVGDWYYSKDATHNKNERIYMGKGKKIILSLVQSRAHASFLKIDPICEYFSFIKPWVIDDRV